MELILSLVELRVAGSLIEKEITTPEYYPLTLNALTNACNQKNNRDPVVSFEETMVVRALELLKEKKLIFTVTGAGIRVPKYRQCLTEILKLSRSEVAVMDVLILRGPQTPGELRSRCGPLHQFNSLEEVQQTLDGLSTRPEGLPPLVQKLPRHAGQKEVRYTHLLSGEQNLPEAEDTTKPEKDVLVVQAENERIAKLEAAVKTLSGKVDELQKQFAEFKKQFE